MNLNKFLFILCIFLMLSMSVVNASAVDDNGTNFNSSVDDLENCDLGNNSLSTIDTKKEPVISNNGSFVNKKIDVENTSNNGVGSFNELQNLINKASGSNVLINLTKDYKYRDGDSKDGIIIENDVTINGNGHTINGANKARAFNLVNSFHYVCILNVYNCTFINCFASDGGAIYSKGTRSSYNYPIDALNFIDCVFTNCHASSDGGAIWTDANVKCINCIFKDNSADQDGGAIFTEKLVNINSCKFINNHAKSSIWNCEGGAIYCDRIGECKNCIFENNTAEYGGAINCEGDDYFFTILNCTFINCCADDNDGGAIWAVSDLKCIDCIFRDNSADVDGSAIFIKGYLELINCIFQNNHANQDGGAIFTKMNLYLSSCIFINNTALGASSKCEGGAIYCSRLSKCENSLFENNSAEYGGAIYIHDDCTITIKDCIFKNNHANKYGGAIYGDDVKIHFKIIHNQFLANKADNGEDGLKGNNIYNYGYYDTITGNYGGIYKLTFIEHDYKFLFVYEHLYNDDSNPCKTLDEYYNYNFTIEGCFAELQDEIKRCYFTGERVLYLNKNYKWQESDDKDGVVIEGDLTINGNGHTINGANKARAFEIKKNSKVTIINLNFYKCSSDGDGGAICNHDVQMDVFNIRDCVFINCNSDGDGGAVWAGNNIICIGCIFKYNHANQDGGALFCDCYNDGGEMESGPGGYHFVKGYLNVESCIFINNTAGGSIWNCEGGAIYASTYGKINNCRFENNSAEYGGALNLMGAFYFKFEVTNCVFIHCCANDNDGGAIYAKNNLFCVNCIFIDNSADVDGGAIFVVGGIDYVGNANCINCSFQNNHAKQDGGAIFVDDEASLDLCIFINNTAGGSSWNCEGGAIYCSKLTKCENCIFKDNSAEYGGAIYIHDGCTITIKDCIFKNNHAKKYGGAIYGDDVKIHFKIIHNQFLANKADKGEDGLKGNNIYNYGHYDTITGNYGGIYKLTFIEHDYIFLFVYKHLYHDDSKPCKTLEEYERLV